ncbi:MAG: exodeoxyribonuclease VII large subunit [Lentimonas sp.]|jgi:exodeoxyribonuclease VII large subunit
MHNIPEFTVAEFSRSMKRIVEDNFGYVRIKGEISGFKKSFSGHLYFNLKDENSFLNAVCFKQMASLVDFKIEDGLEIIASGRVTIYEGRSNYQIIVEKLEIAGIGAILAAIEKRRLKFLEQGFFDKEHKKTLPFIPKTIGVITSPTGVVIEDIIHRINARFPTHILIYPASVQGKNSASEIISGVNYFNDLEHKKPDIIIIARGGGSIEDLLSFNDEELVKTIFKSQIPIISAIGHETDTTLIDYVSDVRAPTPSAAAEISVPVLADLQKLNDNLYKRLVSYFNNFINHKENNLESSISNLTHPSRNLLILQQNFLQIFSQFKNNYQQLLEKKGRDLNFFSTRINKPSSNYDNLSEKISFLHKAVQNNFNNSLNHRNSQLKSYQDLLVSYSYKNVLSRGYSIVRNGKKIINNVSEVKLGEVIEIEVYNGKLEAEITKN